MHPGTVGARDGGNKNRFQGDLRPVEQVGLGYGPVFINRLNEQLPGLQLRLPTEAEWEYSCRAGSMEARYGELDVVAWYDSNSHGETHDVKQKDDNAWGLFDMLGNVWEWCQDELRTYTSKPRTDPGLAPKDAAERVIRGGGWDGSARGVRAAYRNAIRPSYWYDFLGFRCLSSVEPGSVRAELQAVLAP